MKYSCCRCLSSEGPLEMAQLSDSPWLKIAGARPIGVDHCVPK